MNLNIKRFNKKNIISLFCYWLSLFSGLAVIFSIIMTAGILTAYLYVKPSLPPAETIREIPLETPLKIYSRDGRLIDEIGERKRIIVTYDELPEHVIQAFIAAEDRRFFDHPGIDYQGTLRAALNILVTGKISGGGSTLTQQLARDYFLNRKRLFTRKILEAFLAYNIEQEFTKKEIMTLFVNKMFFGQRAYGVAAAAQVFFGKNISNINIAEAATLAGVLPAPSNYNPVRSPNLAKIRRDYVLSGMLQLGFIDDENYNNSIEYPVISKLHGTASELSAPYVAEMVRISMIEKYGKNATRDGYKVITTIDSKIQKAATYSLRRGLLEYSHRQGFQGPIGHINIANLNASLPFEKWPENIRISIDEFSDLAVLRPALVSDLNFDNSADIIFSSGERSDLSWRNLKWAKPYGSIGASKLPKNIDDILKIGDVIYVMLTTTGEYALAEIPAANAAVVSIDPFDGAITSLSGGFDYNINKINHALNDRRQPGSSFKPLIYSAALAEGNTASTILLDAPVVMSSKELEEDWRPSNYSGKFYGEQRLREALVRSMNLATVRLLLEKTGINNAIEHIKPFGFSKDALPTNGGLALGAGSASALDMAQAYAVFANGGYSISPFIIDSIRNAEDELIYQSSNPIVCSMCEQDISTTKKIAPNQKQAAEEEELLLKQMAEIVDIYKPNANFSPELYKDISLAPRIITAQNAFIMQDMLREVIRRGTGVRARRELGRKDLSGKTGTTNDYRDAWFAGFNNDISAVVWVGNDNNEPLGTGEQGSRTALPIWIELMRITLENAPESSMNMPKDMVTVRISKITGCPANSNDTDDVMFEVFHKDNLPSCEENNQSQDIFN
jgi:penicillin-binding protein 1A